MAERKYEVSVTEFELLRQSIEYIKQSVDTLLGNNKDCPVYKKTVDNLVIDVGKNETKIDDIERTLSNIRGRFYGVSLIIGLGSSVISAVITFSITRVIMGG